MSQLTRPGNGKWRVLEQRVGVELERTLDERSVAVALEVGDVDRETRLEVDGVDLQASEGEATHHASRGRHHEPDRARVAAHDVAERGVGPPRCEVERGDPDRPAR